MARAEAIASAFIAVAAVVAAPMALAHCTTFNGLSDPPDAMDATADGSADGMARDGSLGDAGCGNYERVVLADGPIAYWRFAEDGGTTALDSTKSGRDCTYGAAVGRTRGPFACSSAVALLPDAGDTATTCPSGPFDFAGKAFSLEAWIRPHVDDGLYRRVISKQGQGPRSGYDLHVSGGAAGLGLEFELRDNSGQYVCGGVAMIAKNAWTYVLATYDPTSSKGALYVNAKPRPFDCPRDAGLGTTADPLTIGAPSHLGDDGVFIGEIAEVAVYEKALVQANVDAHYEAGAQFP